jgi:thiamine biosynthesis lipoprotein
LRVLLLPVLMCFLIQDSIAQEKRFAFSEMKMGSPLSIIFYDDDSLHATAVAKNCYELVDSLAGIFSDYIDTSELSRLSQSAGTGKYVTLSPAMYDILLESRKAWKNSNGTFDISIGPLVRLWRQARKDKKIPAAGAIAEKRKLVGFQHIRFRKRKHAVQLRTPGMQLDLGGIAQGYIGQQVLYRLNGLSISKALVDVSGDIVMSGPPPGKAGWTIGINLPGSTYKLQQKTLMLSHCSVSTSGDVYQYIEENGVRYSHIVDPTTGYGVTLQRNVTIIAPDATTADWLATSCSILPEKQAGKLAAKMHASLLIATIENGEMKLFGTGRFKNYRP